MARMTSCDGADVHGLGLDYSEGDRESVQIQEAPCQPHKTRARWLAHIRCEPAVVDHAGDQWAAALRLYDRAMMRTSARRSDGHRGHSRSWPRSPGFNRRRQT